MKHALHRASGHQQFQLPARRLSSRRNDGAGEGFGLFQNCYYRPQYPRGHRAGTCCWMARGSTAIIIVWKTRTARGTGSFVRGIMPPKTRAGFCMDFLVEKNISGSWRHKSRQNLSQECWSGIWKLVGVLWREKLWCFDLPPHSVGQSLSGTEHHKINYF